MNWTLSNRLEGIGEYYFATKLREIAELNKAGKQMTTLFRKNCLTKPKMNL